MKKTVMMVKVGNRYVAHEVTRAQAASTRPIPTSTAPRSWGERIRRTLVA